MDGGVWEIINLWTKEWQVYQLKNISFAIVLLCEFVDFIGVQHQIHWLVS